ncbi:MAG: Fic family protein [Solirubrobacterales bacterium]|nr:Fic family protein [Solirubrobacterales bacterium]
MASVEHAGSGQWPSLAFEPVAWASKYEQGSASRNEIRKHQGPYLAAIPVEIADLDVHVPGEVSAAVDEAAVEIARFDEQMGVDIAPFAALLLRSESAASSQIENLTASARAIAEAELAGREGGGNAAQVVANTRAMTTAIDLSGVLSAEAILTMHDALMRPHDPEIAGRWRSEQVWIGGGRLGPHHAQFVPPQHSRVPAAMADLIAFMDRDDMPAMVQAAIAHAQFETIHPFPDGNGRTGRALIHALLRGKGLTRNVTVPVSAGLLVDIDAYFSALNAYRSGEPEVIVARLADASFAAVANGRALVNELREIRASWADRIKARRGANTWRIADLLLAHPVLNAEMIATALEIAPSNVYAPVEPLLAAGVLTQANDKRRGQVWRSKEVLIALDAFAARAGKRRASS